MDLSKAFDYIPHDPLIGKLDSYGLDRNLLKFINSYLDNRKQCVRINNINSDFNDIISGVPQTLSLMIFSFHTTCDSSTPLITMHFQASQKL